MFLVFDSETGGFDPSTSDLLQAGFVLAGSKCEVISEYEFAISLPEYRASKEALAVNKLDLDVLRRTGLFDCSGTESVPDGYTVEQYKAQCNLLKLKNALKRLREDRVEVRLMCHNVPFDRPFLFQWFPWIEYLISYRTIDTIGVALAVQDAGKLPTKNVKLETLTAHFKLEHSGAHTALADAKACLAVYKKLVEIIKG